MDQQWFLVIGSIVVVVWFARAAFVVGRKIYARGRVRGITDAMHGIINGISVYYERAGTPIPDRVAKAVDAMKLQVARARNPQEKCDVYWDHFGRLGDAMGQAVWLEAFEAGERAGQRSALPQDDKIRVDLSLEELQDLFWHAHIGFEHRFHKNNPYAFKNKKGALEATETILRIERLIPETHHDPDELYALAVNRGQMIRNRWPDNLGESLS